VELFGKSANLEDGEWATIHTVSSSFWLSPVFKEIYLKPAFSCFGDARWWR
jgi:hypothetical protein